MIDTGNEEITVGFDCYHSHFDKWVGDGEHFGTQAALEFVKRVAVVSCGTMTNGAAPRSWQRVLRPSRLRGSRASIVFVSGHGKAHSMRISPFSFCIERMYRGAKSAFARSGVPDHALVPTRNGEAPLLAAQRER